MHFEIYILYIYIIFFFNYIKKIKKLFCGKKINEMK